MNYRVAVTEPAEHDAHEIYGWIAAHSDQGAARWWATLSITLDSLTNHPGDLGEAPESDAFSETLRQVLFKTRRGNAVCKIRGNERELVTSRSIGYNDR